MYKSPLTWKTALKNIKKEGRGRRDICKTHQALMQPLRWIPHWGCVIFHSSSDLEEGKKSGPEPLPSSSLFSIYFSILRATIHHPYMNRTLVPLPIRRTPFFPLYPFFPSKIGWNKNDWRKKMARVKTWEAIIWPSSSLPCFTNI